MNSGSVIKLIQGGGVLTMGELEKYLREIEMDAINKGAESVRTFMEDKNKQLRDTKEKRFRDEFNTIVSDTSEFLYLMRRIRNGQELAINLTEGAREIPCEEVRRGGSRKKDKRLGRQPKIQV